jgi:tetratricopeptide (TPR) repeat protein
MMTGLDPTAHKVRDTGGFVLAASYPTLATVLQASGWDTAAFVGSAVLKKRFGFDRGFAIYDDEMPPGALGEAAQRRASDVVDLASRWLEGKSGKPYFLWVHVYDPHLPYDAPPPFREQYKERPYDGEVAYTDQQIGRLLDAVAKWSPNALVAVLSDHGEAFGEHGEYAHGVFLYDTTMRVPFLVAGPGVPAGVRVKQQVRTIDLLPTVLELVAKQAPAQVQGSSLVAMIKGQERALPSYGETMFPRLNMGWSELRSVRTNQWKYIRAPEAELYDLSQDPGETKNVAAAHPDRVRDFDAQLGSGTEKVEPAAVDPQTLRQLRSLGYLGGGASAPQGASAVDPKQRKDVLKLLHEAMYSDAPAARRIALLRQAVAADPTNPSLYSTLGELYSPAEAMRLYQSAVQKGVRSAWLFARMGQISMRQGKKNDAIVLFEAAAQLNPSDYESLQNLAAAYRETGRLTEAEGILTAILKGEAYAPALNELGMVWYQKGDRSTALRYFEKAAELDVTYQLNLGRMLKMQGEVGRARAAFERFLAAKGESAEYKDVVPLVRRELAALE